MCIRPSRDLVTKGVTQRRPIAGLLHRRFQVLLWLLVAAAILRSAWATRLDGFTLDEAYHIAAGAYYARTGDYRLNPEHPPLVKLWIGLSLPSNLRLPPLRPVNDKKDERRFTDTAIFLENDPDAVHQRVRLAMYLWNGVLLAGFAMLLRGVAGAPIALGSALWLAIDPTVAAHLPLAMTDLPLALASAVALLLSANALRSGSAVQTALAGLALGAALGSKHSALVTAMAAAGFGAAQIVWSRLPARRLAHLANILVLAYVSLWAAYSFRFDESTACRDCMNKPLQAKFTDVQNPVLRTALEQADAYRLLPRAYLWGLADVVRAGVEGRSSTITAFGVEHTPPPAYLFPGFLAVKVPVGCLLASLAGLAVLIRSRGPASPPVFHLLGFAALYLAVLMKGNSTYAGVRHALPVFPALALVGAVALAKALSSKSMRWRVTAAVLLALTLIPAALVERPWEYYNELVPRGQAHLLFDDEGVELSQRSRELAAYYWRELAPRGEMPYIQYYVSDEELRRRGVRGYWSSSPDGAGVTSTRVTGTFLISARDLAPRQVCDFGMFRNDKPVARFGSLLVYRGTYEIPWMYAVNLGSQGMQALYRQHPDAELAERLLSESVGLYPNAYFFAVELGNVRMRRGARREAAEAFELASKHIPPKDPLRVRVERQAQRVLREPLGQLAPIAMGE